MPDYQELYNSLARVVEGMQRRIADMESQIKLNEQKEKQWATEKESQLAIFQQMLNAKNTEHNAILEENQRLREELRQAKKE